MSVTASIQTPEPALSASQILRLYRRVFGPHLYRMMWLNTASLVTAFSEVAVLTCTLLAAKTLVSPQPGLFQGRLPVIGTKVELSVDLLLWIAFASLIARMVSRLLEVYYAAKIAADYEHEQRLRLVAAIFEADWKRQREEPSGRIHVLLTKNIVTATRNLGHCGMFVVSLVSLIVLLSATLVIDWVSALIVLSATVSLYFLIRPLSLSAQHRNRTQGHVYTSFANFLAQGTALYRELRLFRAFAPFYARVQEVLERYHHFRVRQLFVNNAVSTLYQNVALLLIIGGLAMIRLTGFNRLESLSLVIVLLIRAFSYGQQLQAASHAIHDGTASLAELVKTEDSFRLSSTRSCSVPLPPIERIAFDHVRFAYDDRNAVLHDLTFEVKHGEMIGIVGPSGSGKTTLAQLILRLYEPQAGEIQINGRSCRDFAYDDWYARFAFVPQDSIMFNESIDECIRFFRRGVTEDEVRAATKQVGLLDDIEGLADGFRTLVGERGSNLSGGQRQRLCIARALAGHPEVLLFDEPTSALDVHSESVIVDVLVELKGKATVFIVAHRLSTLRMCDRVMVLRHGVVEAFAPPEELVENDSYFSEALRLAQSGSA